MSEWFKRLIGKKEKEQVKENVKTAEELRREALEAEKKLATKNGEPWVAVLDTKVNENNPRNGFFELDWNNEFVEQLIDAGYSGETNEQIVDMWFRDLARNILQEEGIDTNRGAGFINVVPIDKGKSEVS
jgi:hypothetical protein